LVHQSLLLYISFCFISLTTVAQTGVITGRVISEDGSGLPGMTLSLLPVTADRRVSAGISQNRALTDLDGNFKFISVVPRVYSIRVSNEKGYVPGHIPSSERNDGRYLRIGDNITITMIKGGAVTGRVTNALGEPSISVQVNAVLVRDAEGKAARPAGDNHPRFTDDRGIYRIYGLLPGTYVIFTHNASFPSFSPDGRDAPTYHPTSTSAIAVTMVTPSAVR
jgi:hypothetical protein